MIQEGSRPAVILLIALESYNTWEDVTVGGVAILVFSDLVESTALLARLGDDRMEQIRRSHVKDVTDAVSAAGGRVIKTLGDGVMASFESALGALRAAAGIQAAVERLNVVEGAIGIAARVGVAVGEPIPDGDDLHGMAVVIASRLCSAAASGEVLVQDLVAALVASRAGVVFERERTCELKGVPTRVCAASLRWRELALETPGAAESTAVEAADTTVSRSPLAAANVEGAPASEAARLLTEGVGPPAGVPLPRMLAAYAGEPLIGRDREIAVLRDATAPRKGLRAVLVLGEPGIGKTRHAAALAAEAHAQGAVVALARCPPEAVVAFEPWVRAIGELALAGDGAWRGALAEAAGSELAALVPELGARETPGERADGGELVAAEGARYRLLRGVGAALAYAAAGEPLYVVLDDAHWCDAASAQALRHLLDGAAATQLVLVATARERELGRRHPVSRVLADLRRTGDLAELRLEGLDAGGLAALVAARVGRAITPRLAARLHARTAGNPFFAAELARDLDGRGALRDGEALDAAPVPDAVTDLVEERLARLDLVTERLLVAVAAIGPSAPVALAARAAGINERDAQSAVAQALSEHLVDDVPAARPMVAFPHALVREALAASIRAADRARLHLAIAQALEEDEGTEPSELARHYGLAVALTGPEPACGAHRAAAAAAAAAHDHEQAARHLRSTLVLLPEGEPAARGAVLLELGEQELLAADLGRAREAFRAAGDIARARGDAGLLARAALGFAGGDVGFGFELNGDDTSTVVLLREGLEALGEDEPRLALRVICRLTFALVYSEEEAVFVALAQRTRELEQRLGDDEARILARIARLYATARGPDPLSLAVFDAVDELVEFGEAAQLAGREDLLFRTMQLSVVAQYGRGHIAECERAIERMAQIAERLGSPRFTWEVDAYRGQRLLDRGDRAGGEALIHRAGATVRRLRPDIQMALELTALVITGWLYDNETTSMRAVFESIEAVGPWGWMSALATLAAALAGDRDTACRRLESLLTEDLAPLRPPDIHVPSALCLLAIAATLVEDRVAGARLRPLIETLRPYLLQVTPAVFHGHVPEWHIGQLELLAGRPDVAVGELRTAVARADALGLAWLKGWARVDLATALHRRAGPGDRERARTVLDEGEAFAEHSGTRWVLAHAAQARAELEGRERQTTHPPAVEHTRPVRALAARAGRRALAAGVRGCDDHTLERRFAEPSRQRALLRAMTRGFQPAHAGGFHGVIAYELEPFAIDPPPDAPWRWAIEVNSGAGHARLLEPAPLDTAVTIHFGLAEWVRVLAGVQNAVTAMAAGRCTVEGDVILAARLETMFGAHSPGREGWGRPLTRSRPRERSAPPTGVGEGFPTERCGDESGVRGDEDGGSGSSHAGASGE
jgi:class 3 adenylate cyclase